MTPSALAARFDAIAADILGEMRAEVMRVAESGKSMVIQRVSETGKDAKGAAFKAYTKAYELRKRGAIGAKGGKKKQAERRTAVATAERPAGRYRGFVDFTLSGRMLTNISLTDRTDGNRVRVVVAGKNADTQQKMDGNDLHRPGWFALSAEEIARLREQSAERMAGYVKRFLEA